LLRAGHRTAKAGSPELTTFAGLTTVKTLVMRDGIWPLLLDRDGIGQIGASRRHEVERWPIPLVPQALWRGADSMFITLENGKVHERGWDRGKRIDHELDAVDQRQVVSTYNCTCMLAAGGTVTCFYHRED
jgi:hypothetical protein